MNPLRAIARREWWLRGPLLVDALLVTLTAVLLLPVDPPWLALLLVGWFALRFGVALGGDDTVQETWEFTLTRPFARGRLFDQRLLLGGLGVFALLAVVGLGAATGARAAFDRLLAEPWPLGGDRAPRDGGLGWPVAVAGVLLAYVFAFCGALGERKPERVAAYGMVAAFAAGLALVVAPKIVSYVLPIDESQIRSSLVTPSDGRMAWAIAGVLALLGLLQCLAARRSFVRFEVVSVPSGLGRLPSQSRAVVAFVFAVLLGIAVLAALLMPVRVR